MGNTKIEWTGKSWNPLRARRISDGKSGHFCMKVSEGCKNCYAEKQNAWTGTHVPYAADKLSQVEIYLDEKELFAPLRWSKATKVFPCSMTDLFADFHSDAMIDRIMAIIVQTPEHTYQVLTKRPERMLSYFTAPGVRERICRAEGFRSLHTINNWPLKNLWLGVSVENQAAADHRIPYLLETPAAIRWISAEPLLGPVDIRKFFVQRWLHQPSPADMKGEPRDYECAIDWVVVGGESKAGARPMHPDWARSLRDQCLNADVAFFFKQWGEWLPFVQHTQDKKASYVKSVGVMFDGRTMPNDALVSPPPDATGTIYGCARVGKKSAGRLLDGIEHNALPEVR